MITTVLLTTRRRVYREVVEAARQRLGDDVTLHVISWNQADQPIGDLVAGHTVLAPAHRGKPTVAPPEPSTPPTRAEDDREGGHAARPVGAAGDVPAPARPHSPASGGPGTAARRPRSLRSVLGATYRWAFRTPPGKIVRRIIRGGLTRQFATMCRKRTDVVQLLDRCDVVIALDTAAIRAGWDVAHRRPEPDVVYSLDAGERVVRRRLGASPQHTSAKGA